MKGVLVKRTEPKQSCAISRRLWTQLYKRSAGAAVRLGAIGALGCEPSLNIGVWKCADAPLFIPPDGSLVPPGNETTVTSDWSTSFENGFCGYSKARGFCYTDADANYALTDVVARTGRNAAAFSITTDPAMEGRQTRCVREGTLPADALYGAWFYIPSRAINNGNWNLIHFRGASDEAELHGLWDVSIQTTEDGRMLPRLLKLFDRGMPVEHSDVELPVAQWFSLQVRLKREATEAGVAALYLNDELVAEHRDVVTDDSMWGQWYVGNLADNLDPSESTIYIDDVSIQPPLDVDN